MKNERRVFGAMSSTRQRKTSPETGDHVQPVNTQLLSQQTTQQALLPAYFFDLLTAEDGRVHQPGTEGRSSGFQLDLAAFPADVRTL